MKHRLLSWPLLAVAAVAGLSLTGGANAGPMPLAPQAAGAIPLLHLAAMGDDPAAKPRRGGGRHRGKAAAETSAGTPEMHKGETAEAAQKAYQKKYGF